MVYYKIKRNFIYRKNFCHFEHEFVRFKSLFLLSKLYNKENLSYYCFTKLSLLGRVNRKSITRIRNMCVLTGRSRGVLRRFKVTRMQMKRLLGTGSLSGVRKSSHF